MAHVYVYMYHRRKKGFTLCTDLPSMRRRWVLAVSLEKNQLSCPPCKKNADLNLGNSYFLLIDMASKRLYLRMINKSYSKSKVYAKSFMAPYWLFTNMQLIVS